MPETFPPSSDDKDRGTARSGGARFNADVRFDDQEVPITEVLIVLACIAFVFVGVGLLAWYKLDSNIGPNRADTSGSNYNAYNFPSDPLPLQPRLEPLGTVTGQVSQSIAQHQLAFEQTLESYGSTCDNAFVHIPIGEAIKLVIPHLPVRGVTSGDLSKTHGLVGGGESNSGRLFQEAPSWYGSNH
jgi:hypothetical protein